MRSRAYISYSLMCQRGVVLIVTLIVLVVMTLGAIALMRSVDTSNLIAGNLAFRQSAVLSGDAGLEAAINWLEVNAVTVTNAAALANNALADGYFASWGAQRGPTGIQTWQDYWDASFPLAGIRTLATDASGNTVSLAIQRMCPNPGPLPDGPAQSGCAYTKSTACGGGSRSSPIQFFCYLTHYRITARVVGPRNTVSFVQVVVAL